MFDTQSVRILPSRSELFAFGIRVKKHWKEIVGGSLIELVIGVLAAMGFNLPPLIVAS